MNLNKQIRLLHEEIDELPAKSARDLHIQLWDATEFLNEGMFTEADDIRQSVEKKLQRLLANCKPLNY